VKNEIPETYTVNLAGVTRVLPVCPVGPGAHIAYLNLAVDVELTLACAEALARLIPPTAGVIVTPYGKALALFHEIRKLTGKPGVVCPKSRTPEMTEGYLSATAVSITTPAKHDFHLSAAGRALVKGMDVVVIDDIVSRGGTKTALESLLTAAGAKSIRFFAVGTEGERRGDVVALHHFPLFLDTIDG
jgi:adenine phosphoribosyltransferase